MSEGYKTLGTPLVADSSGWDGTIWHFERRAGRHRGSASVPYFEAHAVLWVFGWKLLRGERGAVVPLLTGAAFSPSRPSRACFTFSHSQDTERLTTAGAGGSGSPIVAHRWCAAFPGICLSGESEAGLGTVVRGQGCPVPCVGGAALRYPVAPTMARGPRACVRVPPCVRVGGGGVTTKAKREHGGGVCNI